MTRCRVLLIAVVFLCAGSLFAQTKPRTSAAKSANELRNELLRKTTHSYYLLQQHGFAGATFSASVSWESFYRELKAPQDVLDKLVPALKDVRFEVKLDAKGAATVSVKAGPPPADPVLASRVKGAEDGMVSVLEGIFQTWAPMAVTPIFDPADDNSKLDVKLVDGKYQITQKQADVDTQLVVDQSGKIERMLVVLNGSTVDMNPRWRNELDGYLISGYAAVILQKETVQQNMEVAFEYQEMGGMKLLQSADVAVVLPQMNAHILISFGEYKLEQKAPETGR